MLRMSETRRTLPPSNQVGVVAATVLLCFALTHLAGGPGVTMTVQLPGFYFAYSLTLGTAMTMIAAGLDSQRNGVVAPRSPGAGGKAHDGAVAASQPYRSASLACCWESCLPAGRGGLGLGPEL